MDDLVPTALDLPFELVHQHVRGGLVRCGSLAPVEVRPLHVHLRLDEVIVGDLRVALAVEHDLHQRVVLEATTKLCELRLHVAPDSVVDLSVPHRDPQSHGRLPVVFLQRYRTARARQTTSTCRPPAFRSAPAQADAVAPVV